ncbi:unnamed protein product, partial [Mesorhabditis belari]|uniref:Uncharacterized protein n=1 Tax=Mesorhabditis belari TaxID=2138241 RepID=A0AAF3FAF5_9BILA
MSFKISLIIELLTPLLVTIMFIGLAILGRNARASANLTTKLPTLGVKINQQLSLFNQFSSVIINIICLIATLNNRVYHKPVKYLIVTSCLGRLFFIFYYFWQALCYVVLDSIIPDPLYQVFLFFVPIVLSARHVSNFALLVDISTVWVAMSMSIDMIMFYKLAILAKKKSKAFSVAEKVLIFQMLGTNLSAGYPYFIESYVLYFLQFIDPWTQTIFSYFSKMILYGGGQSWDGAITIYTLKRAERKTQKVTQSVQQVMPSGSSWTSTTK